MSYVFENKDFVEDVARISVGMAEFVREGDLERILDGSGDKLGARLISGG